jgi:predicted phage terminase large subunit-like protein
VIIMQRLGEADLAGFLLDNEGGEIVHLCLPCEFEADRRCVTASGGRWINAWGEELGRTRYKFADWRRDDGEPLWPVRFDSDWCGKQQKQVGEFAWAAQFQQRPAPRGGGIIRSEWWQRWPPDDEEEKWLRPAKSEDGRLAYVTAWPAWEYQIGYVDTALSAQDDKENAWCAMTTWGVFADSMNRPKIAMTGAWRDRPTLRGLALKMLETVRRRQLDVVVIENKAGGEWAKQELLRLMEPGECSIALDDVRGDKVARLRAVSVLFENGMVYAPDTTWAEMVIAEASAFPKGRWKDLTDTVSGALGYLRRSGLIRLAEEVDREEARRKVWHGRQLTIAEQYGV